MKAQADNSNFNFSQLCDDVSFAGGPVSVILQAPIWLSTRLIVSTRKTTAAGEASRRRRADLVPLLENRHGPRVRFILI